MELRLSLFFVILLSSHGAIAFDKTYGSEAEIPEPLLFDLVRRINSDRNELEVNALVIHHQHNKFGQLYTAPEVEYAFADGKAIELELPIEAGKVKSYKSAFQMRIPTIIGEINGFQIIYEKESNASLHQITPLFLLGTHVSGKWSIFSMFGSRLVYGDVKKNDNSNFREQPIVNLNVFYDYADMLDMGFEVNLRGVGAEYDELILMPQMHLLVEEELKIQFGFGTSIDGHEFSPLSAFRLIKEFNSM